MRGIVHAFVNDFGYRTQIYLGLAIAVVLLAFFRPISAYEFLFIAFSYSLILITELQNSALEIALDRLHPEIHDDIKHSKDMAAGAVLTASMFLILVISVIGFGKFF